MAKKDSNPLFDYVVKPGQTSRGMGVPQWMGDRQQPDPSLTYYPPGQQPPTPQQAAQQQAPSAPQKPARQPRAFVPNDSMRAMPQPVQPAAPAKKPTQPAAQRMQTPPQAAAPSKPRQPQQPAQPAAPQHNAAASSEADGSWTWFKTPLVFRLPRGTAAVFALSGVGLLVAAFMLGQMQQRRATAELMTDYESQTQTLAQVSADPVNPGLIPPSVYTQPTQQTPTAPPAGAYPANPQPNANATTRGATGAAGTTAAAGPAQAPMPPLAANFEPRKAGLNYFRLQVMPVSGQPEGVAAVEFLRANGIDAMLIPINNGQSLKLMALQGYAKPLSDATAKQYADRIRSLGRLWKAKHNGSTDWSDLFPEKYIPGRT